MPASTTIFHSQHGFSMCYATHYQAVPDGVAHPEHGTAVFCGICGRYGVIPEKGHELEFLPPGTERAESGGFILKFPPPR